MFVSRLLTLQSFTDEHTKLPPPVGPVQGSLKDIFIETFRAFVKGVEVVIYAVGGTVSAKSRYNMNKLSVLFQLTFTFIYITLVISFQF